MNELFRVERLLRGRGDEPIDDKVVDEIGAHRAEEAEIVNLDRRWPRREDARPGVARVSGKVDQDIDPIAVYPGCRVCIAHRPQIDKPVEARLEPAP